MRILKSDVNFDESQWVKIRIWEATAGDAKIISSYDAAFGGDGASNVGHATLQTSKIYASFWPEKVTKVGDSNNNGALLMNTPEDDVLAEGEGVSPNGRKEPTYVVVLYGLHVDAVEACFDNFKRLVNSGERTWMEWGHHWFNKGQNCAGLVLELLQAGKIGRLTGVWDRTILIPTPMDIRKLVLKARETMFEMNADLRNWAKVSGEIIFKGDVPKKGVGFSSCRLT